MGFVVDTSVLIAAERGRVDFNGLLDSYRLDALCLSAISASELLHGLHRAQTPTIAQRRKMFVEFILTLFPIMPFDIKAAHSHAAIWAELSRRGQLIGAHDLIIAATALALDYGVITLNEQEFRRVPDLRVIAPKTIEPQPPTR